LVPGGVERLNLLGRGRHQHLAQPENSMIARSILAVMAVVFALSAGPARAAVCLGKSMSLEEIIAVIDAAPGCERAMKVFKDCEFGTSGDIHLGAAVEKKCEAGFLRGLGASQKRAYQREMGVCDRKYQNESGTMYRSFTAFCRAEIAQRYAQKARKAVPASVR
jgi:hypothetical protein